MNIWNCATLLSLAVVGCGDSRSRGETDETGSGGVVTVRAGGSSTLHAPISRAAAAFSATREGVAITVSHSGSGDGVQKLIAGELEIANCAREPKPREFAAAKDKGMSLKTFQVAFDAIAVVVHPSRYPAVKRLSQTQLEAIFFSGTTSDWSQLSPELSGPIHVYGRDQDRSGSAEAFTELIAGDDDVRFRDDMRYLDSTKKLVPSVAGDENGIAFAPFSFVDASVRALAFEVDGVSIEPSAASVRDFSYPLRRDLFMVTSGMPSGAINDFVQFVLGPEGQRIIAENDLISVR